MCAPAALLFVGGRDLGGIEDVVECAFQGRQEVVLLQAIGDGVEAGAAAHGGKTDEAVGVVAQEVGHHVLDGVQRLGIQVVFVGLAEAQIVFDDLHATAEISAVGDAYVGCIDESVVEFKGLYVEFVSHTKRVYRSAPGCWQDLDVYCIYPESMNSTASPVSDGDEPSKIAPANSAEFIDVDGYDDAFDTGKKKVRLSWSSWKLVLRRTWTDFLYQALGDRAAAMTYFTVMAFAPTVLALYSLATLLFASRRDEVLDLTTGFIEEYVPADLVPQALDLVSSIIGSAAEGTWALVISVLVSLFSASAYVRAFSRTGNLVYGRIEGRGLIRTWATMWGLTIFLVLGLVLVLFANLLRDTVIAGVLEPLAQPLGLEGLLDFLLSIFLPIWAWVRFPLTVLLVLVLIAVLYHFAPNVRPLRFRWITPGAIFALTLSVAVWSLFGLYLRIYAGASAYGAVSTVMAVLLAVWIMNIILIIGIKIDAEILRAKELQVGLESERHIQVPPRDDTAAEAQVQKQLDLESDSRDISRESRDAKDVASADANSDEASTDKQ